MSHDAIEIDSLLGPLTLRAETDADRDFRFRLFCDSRQPEFALLFPPPAFEQLMRHQFQAQTVSYRNDFPRARFDIIELGGMPVGRIVVDRPGDKVFVVDHAIVPEARNKGIGSAIMRALMDEARAAGVPVRLQVGSQSDLVMSLYTRLGFVPIDEAPTYPTLEWRHTAEGPAQC